MPLYNLPTASIELPIQNFIVVLLCTQTTEGLFARNYSQYPEVALEKFIRDSTGDLSAKPVTKGLHQIGFSGTGISIQYLGRGKLKIDLRKRRVGVSNFVPALAEKTEVAEGFVAKVLEVIGQEEGFKGFEIYWVTS